MREYAGCQRFKLGWVKCRFTQHIEGQPSSVTVK